LYLIDNIVIIRSGSSAHSVTSLHTCSANQPCVYQADHSNYLKRVNNNQNCMLQSLERIYLQWSLHFQWTLTAVKWTKQC